MTLIDSQPVMPPPTEQLEQTKNHIAIPVIVRKKREPKHDFKDGHGRVFVRRHTNGRGWVATTAKVDDSVYVGPKCEVFNFACISGKVRLEGNARVSGHATVSGNVVIKQNAHVYGRAVVSDSTTVADQARVFGNAHVSGTSRLYGTTAITDSAQIISCTMSGAQISGQALAVRSQINGRCTILENAIVIDSIIMGFVRIAGRGQVLGRSQLNNTHGPNNNVELLITGNATVADESYITGPIEMNGHAMFVRSRFHNFYTDVGNVPRPSLNGSVIFQRRAFQNAAEIEQAVEAILRPANPQTPTQTGAVAHGNGFPVRQINHFEAASRPRRLQRLEGADA